MNDSSTSDVVTVDGGEQTPVEPVTISPQEPGSDTVVAPPEPARTDSQVGETMTQVDIEALQRDLAEQRRIQAGLTRAQKQAEKAAAEATKRAQELEEKLSQYQKVSQGDEDVIAEMQREIEERQAALNQAQARLDEVAAENERLKIVVGEYGGDDNPIAALVKTNALPQARDADAFRAAMDEIVSTFGAVRQSAMREQSNRPPANPPASELLDVDTINNAMRKAASVGDWDKFDELKEQRYNVLDQRGIGNTSLP